MMKSIEIDLHNPKIQKLLIAVLVFAGVNYVYFFTDYLPFGYRPQKTVVEEKRDEYKKLAAKVEEAKRASANIEQLENELSEMHARWATAMSHLPEKKEVASLLRRMTLAGEHSGIKFLLFEPDAVICQGVYDEHPVNVKVRGSYHSIGSFLDRLMNLDRIVHVSEMQFESVLNDQKEPVVTGEMIVSAYTVPLATTKDTLSEPVNEKRNGRRNARSRSVPEPSNE